jgi:transposase
MFLKRLTRNKDGKRHTYWALVESIRTDRGPRHRIVSYLGELKQTEQNRWAKLAQEGVRHARQRELFEDPSGTPDYVTIDLKKLKITRVRDFGRPWMGMNLWHLLGLGTFFQEVLPEGREEISWSVMAEILTLARLCEPGSELAIEERWYRQTAMEDLVGVPADKVNTDRLYRALDEILPHKGKLEKHLKERMGTLFDVKFDVLLYDVTSTFFEGKAEGNAQAQRGHSRDQRYDCKQVCLALVVTQEGIPLAYEVFDGNRTDVTTVEDIVEAVEEKYGSAQRIWVMDRGMVSEDNLDFLQERNGSYLVGTPKQSLRRFEQHLVEKDWVEVQPGVDVKTVPSPEGNETYLLCRSRDRERKDHAIYERFFKRIEKKLTKLAESVAKGRMKKPSQIERRIGDLLGKNSRAAKSFEVELKNEDGQLRLEWHVRKDWEEWAKLSEGCYLLRTNLVGWDPARLWKTYIQLTDAEAAFRTLKSDLGIRPIWHQKQNRVQAHILVCFLGYVLWKTLGQWMQRLGLGTNPRTLLKELEALKAVDVLLHTQEGQEVRLSCIAEPEPPLADLLARLGMVPPKRLRPAGLDQIEVKM